MSDDELRERSAVLRNRLVAQRAWLAEMRQHDGLVRAEAARVRRQVSDLLDRVNRR